MTATTVDKDRGLTGGQERRLPLQASANPFSGSYMSFASTGYVHELVAGEPFAGICRGAIPTAYSPSADGGSEVEVIAGRFTMMETISGAAIADVYKRRKVYASDDNTLTFTPTGNTFIGVIEAIDAGGKAIIAATTCECLDGPCSAGIEVLADAAATLTTAQLDKLLVMTPTAGRTLTLPLAADCAGRSYTVKTLATQIITLDGAGAETIDGAATNVLVATANFALTIVSDGVKWLSISGKLA